MFFLTSGLLLSWLGFLFHFTLGLFSFLHPLGLLLYIAGASTFDIQLLLLSLWVIYGNLFCFFEFFRGYIFVIFCILLGLLICISGHFFGTECWMMPYFGVFLLVLLLFMLIIGLLWGLDRLTLYWDIVYLLALHRTYVQYLLHLHWDMYIVLSFRLRTRQKSLS